MGSPMATNLLKNGYPVIATDVFPESCKELQDIGAQVRCCLEFNIQYRLFHSSYMYENFFTILVKMGFVNVQVVDSPADVADRADRIITMLPSSPNVIEVYTGPNGILK